MREAVTAACRGWDSNPDALRASDFKSHRTYTQTGHQTALTRTRQAFPATSRERHLSLRSSSYIQLRHKYATARVAEFPEARGVMLRILFTHTHRVVIASTTIQVTTAAPCEAHMTQRIAVGARDRLRSCRPTAPCSRRREGRQREQQSDHRHVPKSPHELGHGSILSAVVPLIAQNARQSAATTLADGAPVPSLAAGPGEHAAPGSGRRRERRQREQQSGGKQLPQHRDLPCRPMLPTTRGAVVVCHADARAACPQAARFPFACTFDWCIETTFTAGAKVVSESTRHAVSSFLSTGPPLLASTPRICRVRVKGESSERRGPAARAPDR